MKSLLSLLGRYALTLIAVAVAAFVAFIFWKQYAQTPWTRDGRVRADVVQIAPDVSGPVSSVAVRFVLSKVHQSTCSASGLLL